MYQKPEDIAQEILREFEEMSGDRGNWEGHWQEIAERMDPSHSTAFTSQGTGKTTGEKRTDFIFDSTASIALNRFGAILDSLLTPRNQTWHRLMPSDPYLKKNRTVQMYFEDANRILFKHRYSPTANFSSQNQQNYKSLGAYGTGGMFIDELYGNPGLRYKNVHLGELYIAENHQGIVDKVLRRFPRKLRQAFQKWGNKLPKEMLERVDRDGNKEYMFIHCVKPRKDLDPTRKDYKGMPFVSYYVCEEGKKLISEGGYTTFPYSIPRYEQYTNEVYGRSPAMSVLPAVKTLNEQMKTLLKQGHRAVDPILLAHDDGIVDSFSLRPGAINAGGVSAEGRALVQALPVGNIAVGKDLMDDNRVVINDAFLVTLFQILTETPNMTATEVLERTKEKGILIAPTIGRQQSEYLGPMIEREIDLLSKQGLLPPMPGILKEAQGDYTVEYDSPLSRAQRAEEASGLMRTIETVLNVVNITQNPEPLDHFNWDIIVPEVGEIQGVPLRWMRSPESVADMRSGRQEQQNTQEMIQAGPAAAAMMKAEAVAKKAK